MIKNTELLDQIIVGYVPHRIYVFSTSQADNYLKVGETSRSVTVRLKEWQSKITDLKHEKDWLAMLPKDAEEQNEFFQDFALHKYFKEKGFEPLKPEVAPGNSKEFYPVTIDNVESGIEAIGQDYDGEPPHQYRYLNIEDNSRVIEQWARTENFKLRHNQKEVIDNIVAVSKDKIVTPNYLLFAVMRFGKTFVALEAAKSLDSKLTMVVSAKADVKLEWKQNLESHKDFEGYVFLDSNSLIDSSTAIEDCLKENKVVLFLTLQDLKGGDIKEKHKQLFDKKVDFLIVDESHFGARAQSYGQAIYESDDTDDNDEIKALDNIKEINRDYTLHLSGTPYRILMGSEFSDPKQIVGKIQFEDILDDKAKWYEEHLYEPEWKNPYFGFPQMIRFAFNINEEAKQKIAALNRDGKKSQLNELFGPMSTDKYDESHVKFRHESYVLDTLQALDGSVESESIFPILNYEKLKEGKMARHIIMVLPFKASCDAMEKLLIDNNPSFTNFSDYKIINIAGHDAPSRQNVKKKIADYANKGEKTISLTVNKMLTGVTVPQWDTMIFLKDTQSPQEYDQAIYRLQSPYVTKQMDNNGNILNMEDLKPQTLLIDFAPNRMMSIEQYKAFVLTASEGGAGNDKVKESLSRQMIASPIITINSEKLTQVQPADILKYIAAYSSEKGIIEEAREISVDLSILDNDIIKKAIDCENEIGSKLGIKYPQNDDGDNESDFDDVDFESDDDDDDDDEDSDERDSTDITDPKDENKILVKRIQNYYLRILFYAFLSEEKEINNFTDVIDSFDNNSRLASHLGIEKIVLYEIDKVLTHPWVRSDLDNKISNANSLLSDDSVEASEKVGRAIRSFKQISESEVFTPIKITELMVDQVLGEIDFTDFNHNPKLFIDITSKSGIYLLVLFDRLVENGVNRDIAKNCLYSVATSPVAYEFTRKVYELMGFPVEHILDIELASSYDLIKKEKLYGIDILNEYYFKGDENMKFDAVVGNPPYQENIEGRGEQPPIYHNFYDVVKDIADIVTLITPARFLFDAGKTPSTWNQKMLNDPSFKIIDYYPNSKDVFSNVDIKGGVVISLWNSNKDYGAIEIFVPNPIIKGILLKVKKDSNGYLSDILYSNTSYKYDKSFFEENPEFSDRVSGGSRRYLISSVFDRFPEVFYKEKPNNKSKYIQIIGRINYERVVMYFPERYLIPPNNFKNYKVYLASSNGSGILGESLSIPILGEPKVGATETFVSFGNFENKEEANNLLKYIKCKFTRLLLGTKKVTQGNKSRKVWSNVVIQDFTNDSDIDWTQSVSDIDKQLYKKYKLNKEEINLIESEVEEME